MAKQYIDKEAAIKYVEELKIINEKNRIDFSANEDAIIRFLNRTEFTVSLDLVRCYQCKFSQEYKCKEDPVYYRLVCKRRKHYFEGVDDMDFCSYGKREEKRMNNIKTGDLVMCVHSEYYGVRGKVIKQYFPTACEQQTMIECDNGRAFHAPTRYFVKVEE